MPTSRFGDGPTADKQPQVRRRRCPWHALAIWVSRRTAGDRTGDIAVDLSVDADQVPPDGRVIVNDAAGKNGYGSTRVRLISARLLALPTLQRRRADRANLPGSSASSGIDAVAIMPLRARAGIRETADSAAGQRPLIRPARQYAVSTMAEKSASRTMYTTIDALAADAKTPDGKTRSHSHLTREVSRAEDTLRNRRV